MSPAPSALVASSVRVKAPSTGAALIRMLPAAVASAVLSQWVFKCVYEALATPLTYAVVNSLKRVEGLDVFDRETDFRPVAF